MLELRRVVNDMSPKYIIAYVILHITEKHNNGLNFSFPETPRTFNMTTNT